MTTARYEEALSDFNAIISYGDASAYAYYRRAWCYEIMEDYVKELADLDKAIEMDSKDPSQYERRGSIHLNSARPYALFYLGKHEDAAETE